MQIFLGKVQLKARLSHRERRKGWFGLGGGAHVDAGQVRVIGDFQYAFSLTNYHEDFHRSGDSQDLRLALCAWEDLGADAIGARDAPRLTGPGPRRMLGQPYWRGRNGNRCSERSSRSAAIRCSGK